MTNGERGRAGDDPACACNGKTCAPCAERAFWALYAETQRESDAIERDYASRCKANDERMMGLKKNIAQCDADDAAAAQAGIVLDLSERRSKLAREQKIIEAERENIEDWYHTRTFKAYAIPSPDPGERLSESDDSACKGYTEADGSVYTEVSPRNFRDYLRRRHRTSRGQ